MIVSVSLPDELVAEVDALVRARRAKGRSDVVRSALREYLKAQQREEKLTGRVNVVVSLCYPEHMERSVTDLRHEHVDLVKSMLHAHTTRGRCATVLLAEGDDERMKRFLGQLRGLRELDTIDVTVL